MVGRLTAFTLALLLVAAACSTDDPTTAPPGTTIDPSTTTTAVALAPLPSPPPAEDQVCQVVETAARVDDAPSPPEFADARLEAGLADHARASAVFERTVWLAEDDSVPGGDPTGGPVRVLTALPDTCAVHDLTVVDDDLYAIACKRETTDECSVHRVDPRSGEVRTSKPADNRARFFDNDEVLLVSAPFRFRALYFDLTERWSSTELLLNRPFVTQDAIWFNQSEGLRLDPETGDVLDPFDPDDRVVGVAGELAAVVDIGDRDPEAVAPSIRLLDGELGEHGAWDAAGLGLFESGQPVSGGLLITQGEGGSPFLIGIVDLETGELSPIADYSGEPVSRGGAWIIEWLDIIDNRVWFWWESSLWSLPAPGSAACPLEVIGVPAVDEAAPPVASARLEFPIVIGGAAQPVVLDTVWVAFQDRPDPGGGVDAAARGIVAADPEACRIRDLIASAGFVFVNVCTTALRENSCEHHRIDPARGVVDRVAPTETTGWIRDAPSLIAAGGGFVESLDSELQVQWRTEARPSRPVVSDSFVWSADPAEGRIELSTGEWSEVDLGESARVIAADGSVVIVATEAGGTTSGRTFTEDLAEVAGREPWSIRFSSVLTSISDWQANPFLVGLDDDDPDDGSVILASIDLVTGDVVQYGSHVAGPIGRSGLPIPFTIGVVDDRIWFTATGGIWSVVR